MEYSDCPAAYRFQYEEKLFAPRDTALAIGIAVHRFAETYQLDRVKDHHRHDRFDHAIYVARNAMRLETETKDFLYGNAWQKGPVYTPILMAQRLVSACQTLQPILDAYTPEGIEAGYLIHWTDENVLPVLGFQDVSVVDENGPVVIDYKTSGRAKSELDLVCDVGMTAYAIGDGLTRKGGGITQRVRYENVVMTKDIGYRRIMGMRTNKDVDRLYNRAPAPHQSHPNRTLPAR